MPVNVTLLFHVLFVLRGSVLFSLSFQKHLSSYWVQCEVCEPAQLQSSQFAWSSEGFSALLKGIFDVKKKIKSVSHSLVLRSPDTDVFFFFPWTSTWRNTSHKYILHPILQIIRLWVLFGTTARENVSTILQSRSSSRFPDSSCNPDSWEERETWLLQTVPTGGRAKEQQQSIKHAVKTSSAALLLCSSSPPRI